LRENPNRATIDNLRGKTSDAISDPRDLRISPSHRAADGGGSSRIRCTTFRTNAHQPRHPGAGSVEWLMFFNH
jgi:hypothetical protein